VEQLSLGESIAVNGVCLTVRKIPAAATFVADVMQETLRRTTLGSLKVNSPVNLELPMKASGRFGGHIVQGHVDGTTKIIRIQKDGKSRVITCTASEKLLKYMVEKGSIAIDGISLTLMGVGETSFSVGIIPHTRDRTTLTYAAIGDMANVEVDMVAKYVYKFSSESLKKHREE